MLAQWTPPGNHPTTPLHVPTGTVVGAVVLGLLIAAAGIALLRQERQENQEEPESPVPDADRRYRRRSTPGSFLAGLGGAVVVGALVMAALAAWSQDRASGGLNDAGQEVITQAVQGAQECVTSPPQPFPGPDGNPIHIPCPTDPRGNYAGSTSSSRLIVNSAGVYTTELTQDYAATGHVQVTSDDTHDQVCVTVPTTATDPGSVTPGACG